MIWVVRLCVRGDLGVRLVFISHAEAAEDAKVFGEQIMKSVGQITTLWPCAPAPNLQRTRLGRRGCNLRVSRSRAIFSLAKPSEFDVRLVQNTIMKNNNLLPVIVCGWLIVFVTGCASESSQHVSNHQIPESIAVTPNEVQSFTASAKGVQIYECRAKKDDATQYEWVLKAPEADLFDERGKKTGRHYGGPTWEWSDGSKVMGEVKGREPSPDTNAIPWLLLVAKKHEGDGVFSRVSSIQRMETAGGKSPAGGCDQSSMGKELRVPYTAVYYFYVQKP